MEYVDGNYSHGRPFKFYCLRHCYYTGILKSSPGIWEIQRAPRETVIHFFAKSLAKQFAIHIERSSTASRVDRFMKDNDSVVECV